jgi:CheY-like chemotaxis protein
MRDLNSAIAKGLVILLAEDDDDDVILVRRPCEHLGLTEQFMVVHDGEEVVAYLEGQGPYADREAYPAQDILLLDYRMPRLSGLGVLCWLRNEPRFESLPVVLLSSAFSAAQIETASRMRVACCSKLVACSAMMEALEESIHTAFRLVRGSELYAGAAPNRAEVVLS